MNKEFIPYEQALALKQLGFNEPCFGYYVTVEVPNPFLVTTKISDTQGGYFTFAPLFQQAFRWFREKYNLNGILNHYPNTKLWDFSVHDLTWSGKEFIEHVKKEDRSIRYSTYEEAELACLIKLIEIVKNK
jgi:hypothetical protein